MNHGLTTEKSANGKKRSSERGSTSTTKIQKLAPLGRRQSSRFGRTAFKMIYRLQVRLAAEADVVEAAEWYDQRQSGLGEKFVREVDQALARVVENPLAFPVILKRHEVRRALTMHYKLKKFI
jgi:hypothetical protein